jgi:endogenous inhibitor of DNA gyrase (YacG/DUF329 family)
VSQPYKCPICKREVPTENNPAVPFCSSRCRLIDLGNWLGDRYRIPGESVDLPTSSDEGPGGKGGDDDDDARH